MGDNNKQQPYDIKVMDVLNSGFSSTCKCHVETIAYLDLARLKVPK